MDLQGRTTPRYTTIYDAARRLYVKEIGDEKKIPIPVLCHQPHMRPVAVCRLSYRSDLRPETRSQGSRAQSYSRPAWQHEVKEGMEVFTMNALWAGWRTRARDGESDDRVTGGGPS